MTSLLDRQALALHSAVAEMIRVHQLRDRDEICCHGVTVAQCYALEAIGEAGQPRMNELAGRLRLQVSTLTRTVDQLVERGLVERCIDPGDRRVCCVSLTATGREKLTAIHDDIIRIEKDVLRSIPREERESMIRGLETLTRALLERCCGPKTKETKS